MTDKLDLLIWIKENNFVLYKDSKWYQPGKSLNKPVIFYTNKELIELFESGDFPRKSYLAGIQAFKDGLHMEDNPYNREDTMIDYYSWSTGWCSQSIKIKTLTI